MIKKMKKKYIMVIAILISVVAILGFNFYTNYSLQKLPPSEKWSKEVGVGLGIANDRPVLIKEEDRILIAYEDEHKVIVSELDLLGNTIKEQEYKTDSDFIKNMMFVKSKEGYNIIFIYGSKANAVLQCIHLDENLSETGREDINNVTAVYQVDSETVVMGGYDSVRVVNEVQDINISIPTEEITTVTGTKIDDEILVGFIENKYSFKSVMVSKNMQSDVMEVASLSQIDKLTYSNFTVSGDKDKAYFLYDEYMKGEYAATRSVELDLKTKETVQNKLSVNGTEYIVNSRGAISTEGGKFYATIERLYGHKDTQKDILGFTLKDGEVVDVEIVSRLRELCLYAYADEEYITFLSFEDGKYKVNLCSSNEEFKAANNGFRSSDVKNSLLFTLQGVMMSAAYIVVLGFRWILPAIFIAGVASFFDYNFSVKKKLNMYLILAALAFIFKAVAIVETVYKVNGAMLPTMLASPIVGVILCLLVSIVVFGCGYYIYKDDADVIFVAHFGLDLIIDSLLTCMIFVPLIV